MDHKLKCKIIKLLVKDIGKKFSNLELVRVLAWPPKLQSIQGKKEKLVLIKMKIVYSMEAHGKRIKR